LVACTTKLHSGVPVDTLTAIRGRFLQIQAAYPKSSVPLVTAALDRARVTYLDIPTDVRAALDALATMPVPMNPPDALSQLRGDLELAMAEFADVIPPLTRRAVLYALRNASVAVSEICTPGVD